MTSFRQREGAVLRKSPDFVVVGLDGPGVFCLVHVKIVDPAAGSYSTPPSGQAREDTP